MPAPDDFTWIDKPRLAAMAHPGSLEEYQWLRDQGVQLVISLSETPPRRNWINDAGLFSMHIPVEDTTAPTQDQIDQCVTAIDKALASKVGVAIHCMAGKGRTGTMLACWFVAHGLSARDALTRIRRLRPGSVETSDQADAVAEFARRRKLRSESDGP